MDYPLEKRFFKWACANLGKLRRSRFPINEVSISGLNKSTFSSQLETLLIAAKPVVLGVATAFLSVSGGESLVKLVKKSGTNRVRLVVGLSGCVTHPKAIRNLVDAGYSVRLGVHPTGIFHPKIFVGGASFGRAGELTNTCCGYVGSANLTRGGLLTNLEVGLGTSDTLITTSLSSAFAAIWTTSRMASDKALEQYEEAFARIQRDRSLEDLLFLNVVEAEEKTRGKRSAILVETRHATAVWAGLQSFTGEHSFQVEFPRRAGEVLRTLLGVDHGQVTIECVDGRARSMVFRYYKDNGMYRLNVPNDMPLVDWARAAKQGALLVWQEEDEARLTLHTEIICGRRLNEAVSRSKALGTWGNTTTREYGWY